ncbi:hypothetical protein SDC9_102149 [bioreactor metagenome]|uniref:Uncharacterized protein n=1 Tax=bioreactor metagenome TaxID=1076179 RepID=A0A645B0S4_9ZZZZ
MKYSEYIRLKTDNYQKNIVKGSNDTFIKRHIFSILFPVFGGEVRRQKSRRS